MVRVYEANINDIPLIRELVFKVWPQTYRGILADAQIDYMLEMMYSEASLKKQIQQGAVFIILYRDQEPIAYASYQDMGNHIYRLHKIYVLPGEQGKGLGRYLIDYVMDICRKNEANNLELTVNRNNKARFFYEKLGFTIKEEILLDIGEGWVMDDYIMVKTIDN